MPNGIISVAFTCKVLLKISGHSHLVSAPCIWKPASLGCYHRDLHASPQHSSVLIQRTTVSCLPKWHHYADLWPTDGQYVSSSYRRLADQPRRQETNRISCEVLIHAKCRREHHCVYPAWWREDWLLERRFVFLLVCSWSRWCCLSGVCYCGRSSCDQFNLWCWRFHEMCVYVWVCAIFCQFISDLGYPDI